MLTVRQVPGALAGGAHRSGGTQPAANATAAIPLQLGWLSQLAANHLCLAPSRQSYNDSECGFLYSTADQVGFCPVAEPPLWPALLDVPQVGRAGGWVEVGWVESLALRRQSGVGPALLYAPQVGAVGCGGCWLQGPYTC